MAEITEHPWYAGSGLNCARLVVRVLAAVFFVGAGANHFQSMGFYERIVPPNLPWPRAAVVVSGLAEMVGGIGLLLRPLRRAAAWGLIALLVAVFPANLYMAMEPGKFADLHLPARSFVARLPLQVVFVAWVWFAGLGMRIKGDAN